MRWRAVRPGDDWVRVGPAEDRHISEADFLAALAANRDAQLKVYISVNGEYSAVNIYSGEYSISRSYDMQAIYQTSAKEAEAAARNERCGNSTASAVAGVAWLRNEIVAIFVSCDRSLVLTDDTKTG